MVAKFAERLVCWCLIVIGADRLEERNNLRGIRIDAPEMISLEKAGRSIREALKEAVEKSMLFKN